MVRQCLKNVKQTPSNVLIEYAGKWVDEKLPHGNRKQTDTPGYQRPQIRVDVLSAQKLMQSQQMFIKWQVIVKCQIPEIIVKSKTCSSPS